MPDPQNKDVHKMMNGELKNLPEPDCQQPKNTDSCPYTAHNEQLNLLLC